MYKWTQIHIAQITASLRYEIIFDTSVCMFYLNLYYVYRLEDPGLRSQHARVEATASRGYDLTAATMDGVRVKGHVVDVEAHASHVLLTQNTL